MKNFKYFINTLNISSTNKATKYPYCRLLSYLYSMNFPIIFTYTL